MNGTPTIRERDQYATDRNGNTECWPGWEIKYPNGKVVLDRHLSPEDQEIYDRQQARARAETKE